MKNKTVWLFSGCLTVVALVLASCGSTAPSTTPTTTPPPTTAPQTLATPTGTGKWWDKFGEPQYGGSITLRSASDVRNFDIWYGGPNNLDPYYWYWELATMPDWTLDRQTYGFQASFMPGQYRAGLVAESWEQTDPLTVTIHVRKGVRWQNKPPVNGRELTASDIEYSYHRLLGLGSGFTKPSPYVSGWAHFKPLASVTATDKYTVVFKTTEPVATYLWRVAWEWIQVPLYYPREVVDRWGGFEDWKNAIGSGPWILQDYVVASSLTYAKNPNYWRNDERHPKNAIPYVDVVEQLIIPDDATALAGLRTAKIDLMDNVSWEQAKALKQTNPELIQGVLPGVPAMGPNMRVDVKPFDDIRVRKALNMAIDRKTIGASYYGGLIEGIPYGFHGPTMGLFYTPYTEWPKEVQEGYSYNPEGAKKLLAEAGYPSGFKTNIIIKSTGDDLDLAQVIKGYWAKINVDMEIRTMDAGVWSDYVQVKNKHDQMYWYITPPFDWAPWVNLLNLTSGFAFNSAQIKDPVLDDLYFKGNNTFDQAELVKIEKQLDLHAMSQFYKIAMMPAPRFVIYQPWLKGYSNEKLMQIVGVYAARLWIDQGLKKSMGH